MPKIGVPTKVHYSYASTNAKSHVNPLTAIAEITDNSKDAKAKKVHIDYDSEYGILIFRDDGVGMDKKDLENCLNLGYSKKRGNSEFIGEYGNGFKSSYRALGKDVIIATKFGSDRRIRLGFISDTYGK